MAKMKTFAVEVEVTRREILFVEARRPNGAAEKIQTEEGWREATSYNYDDGLPSYFDPKSMKIIKVKEAY
jgi:hypothetical protein